MIHNNIALTQITNTNYKNNYREFKSRTNQLPINQLFIQKDSIRISEFLTILVSSLSDLKCYRGGTKAAKELKLRLKLSCCTGSKFLSKVTTGLSE